MYIIAALYIAAEDMHHDQMKKLRTELGDVHSVLATIHKDLVTSASLGQYMYYYWGYNYYASMINVCMSKINVTFIQQKRTVWSH